MPRYLSITSLRAIGVLLMVLVHFAWYLALPQYQQGPVCDAIVFLGELAAPLFFFTMGVSLVISDRKRGKNALSHVCRRGVGLTVAGLVLIHIWQGSILHYLGIYSIIVYAMLRFSKMTRLVTAAVILVATPFVLNQIGSQPLKYLFTRPL